MIDKSEKNITNKTKLVQHNLHGLKIVRKSSNIVINSHYFHLKLFLFVFNFFHFFSKFHLRS